MKQTDRDWERWGADSPYYGVLSVSKFRRRKLDGEAEEEFFASGEAHVSALWAAIERREGSQWYCETAVDVGAGVGRLSLPMAARCRSVLAVDVSNSMLAAVRSHCKKNGVANLSTAKADDTLSAVPPGRSLVHSYLVFQHVAPSRGLLMLSEMADRVAEDGYLAFQIYTACNANPIIRSLVRLSYFLPPLQWGRNLLRGRGLFEPPMHLHTYPVARILRLLRLSGFSEVELYLDSEDHGNFESVFILAKKIKSSASIINRYG
ncbi:class I SAM-dependent methyltransferase [Xanthomonas cerealis pv. cerealis]|uniref:class I SAM-dependent methyltransferase n=1 Tax=Xanthomonas cerealis TaxID=3390025 RepID=UPI001F457E01|nr:class I SAM-dependent methyltransferase [Xanthomonas translucens]UKE70334.1 class I SAM-dependent methyltransferase [Xanthomonas translucens pv. pistacia]